MSFATPVANNKRVQFNRELGTRSATAPSGTKRQTTTLVTPSAKSVRPAAKSESQTPKAPVVRNSVSNTSSRSGGDNNLIKVGIRVRPANEKEIALGNKNIIKIDEEKNEILLNENNSKHHRFKCDFIITDQTAVSAANIDKNESAENQQQQHVYECAGKPLLDKAFDGYNVSIFAYGQTGSGKTYSMIGTGKSPGLIPRFFDDLFEKSVKRDNLVSSSHIEISYYEIYNEKIFDLLRETKEPVSQIKTARHNLAIREDKQKGPYIVGLQALSINSAKDAKMWLDIGNKRRATAYTNMNDKSSRSHSVFQIKLTQMLEHKTDNIKTTT